MSKRKPTEAVPQPVAPVETEGQTAVSGTQEEAVSGLATGVETGDVSNLGTTAPAAATAVSEAQPGQAAAANDGGSEGDALPQLAVVSSPNGLNLRQGPAVLFPVLAVLQSGDAVERLPLPQEVPGWALVRAGEAVGWVDARFLAWQEE